MFFRALYIYKYIYHIFTGAIIAQIRDSGESGESVSLAGAGGLGGDEGNVFFPLPLLPFRFSPNIVVSWIFCVARVYVNTNSSPVEVS